ncbi:hypothetical protein A3E42_06520 [Candidatus Gottesmanbacteria bacterium RIFCSPHIGHO2_12_FULL_40_13]|nr:MAG: hypothetical protein A3E42_06520 [Candidatus Gottesmanbacteria bacterium RIFCSPHIGHO2_12_FULL_40_13]
MEQHPVPRNISSFQFHLVGDMTMRQFLYLAGGAFIAFLIFKFAPLPALLKWPMALSTGFGGFAFAFLPIQERPLDKWLLAFLRSINAPTQYIWRKEETMPDILARSYTSPIKRLPQNHQEAHQDAQRKLDMYMTSVPKQPHQTLNIAEKRYIDQTLQLFNTTGVATTGQVQPGFYQPQVSPQIADLTATQEPVIRPEKHIKNITDPTTPKINIQDTPPVKEKATEEKDSKTIKTDDIKPAGKIQTEKTSTGEIIREPNKIPDSIGKVPAEKRADKKDVESATPVLQTVIQSEVKKTVTDSPREDSKLSGILAEKEKLELELKQLKDELEKSRKPDIVKPQLAPEKKVPTIKTVTLKTAVDEIGIPKLPQVPNIIMGVIKDTQRKILPNIILTIKDTKGVPHRALKTNRLGQFSTATPLQNGTYYIEAEDPLKRYVFDIGEINLTGKVFLPIEMTAKGEKELMREKLTKEIFGNPRAA